MTVKKKQKTKRKAAGPKKVKSPRQQLSAPELFFKKLTASLKAAGLDPAVLDTKTSLLDPPPCFALRSASYAEWCAAAVNAEPPLRVDMPAEPNYCRDCTARFRRHAVKAGSCLFPHMRLEKQPEFGEKLFVGITHSRLTAPEGFVKDPVRELLDPAA
jgi:hypothetical protein